MKRQPRQYKYDVCISFAGADRAKASRIASELRRKKFRVFYDDYEAHTIWGKDLFRHLFRTYAKDARFCIILFSKNYLKRNWTNHELKAAQLRTLKERREYVLPIVLDRSTVPDEFKQIGRLHYDRASVKSIGDALGDKLAEQLSREGWIPEKEMLTRVRTDMIDEVFVNGLLREILGQKDHERALAMAAAAMIYLLQDEVRESYKAMFSTLLSQFPPLLKYFLPKNRFAFVRRGGTMYRWVSNNGHFTLLMDKQFLEGERKKWQRRKWNRKNALGREA